MGIVVVVGVQSNWKRTASLIATALPPLSFLQAGCPSYRLTSSVKSLKATPLTISDGIWIQLGFVEICKTSLNALLSTSMW